MPMGFDFQSAGQPDFNLRQRDPRAGGVASVPPSPAGHPGGNVRPVMPTGAGGGLNPAAQGPQPNAQAFAHANDHARFMRTDAQGNQFADNPAGQRPGPNQNAMDNANQHANFLRALQGAMTGQGEDPEMRRRRMMEEMRRRGGFGGGQMGGSGGIYGGYPGAPLPTEAPMINYGPNGPQPQYSFPAAPLPAPQPTFSAGFNDPSYSGMTTLPAPYQQPSYSFPAAPLPVDQQQPRDIQSMYNLISPF